MSRVMKTICCAGLVLFTACNITGPKSVSGRNLKVRLLWVQSYPEETWEKAKQGLWWALSGLGALPPPDEKPLQLISRQDQRVIMELDLAAAGFHPAAVEPLRAAVTPILESDEMRLYGAVDIGRFLMLTLYEPEQYYTISGAAETLAEFRASSMQGEKEWFAVTASLLTESDRLVEFNAAPASVSKMGFVVSEGHGSLVGGDFVEQEFEVIDFMDNGRQRFTIYDVSGKRLETATISPAGQPGKCMWCHEMRLQTGSSQNQTVPPYLSFEQFRRAISDMQQLIDRTRREQVTAVNYEEYHVHTWSELLAEMFLSPSAERLALEWQLPLAETEQLLADAELQTHVHEEYPQFGPLYTRRQADSLYLQILPELAGREGHPLYGKEVSGYRNLWTRNSAREAE